MKKLNECEMNPNKGRYVILDTETTGFSEEDHILEINCFEIINGKISRNFCHIYLKPRVEIKNSNIHGITKNFYEEYRKENPGEDRIDMINLLEWVKDSTIISYNSNFDMKFLNKELKFHNLPIIYPEKFKCLMKISNTIIKRTYPYLNPGNISLQKTCELLKINPLFDYKYFLKKKSNYEKNKIIELFKRIGKFHTAVQDSFLSAKLFIKLIKINNPNEEQKINFNNKKSSRIDESNKAKDFYNPNKKDFNYLNDTSSDSLIDRIFKDLNSLQYQK